MGFLKRGGSSGVAEPYSRLVIAGQGAAVPVTAPHSDVPDRWRELVGRKPRGQARSDVPVVARLVCEPNRSEAAAIISVFVDPVGFVGRVDYANSAQILGQLRQLETAYSVPLVVMCSGTAVGIWDEVYDRHHEMVDVGMFLDLGAKLTATIQPPDGTTPRTAAWGPPPTPSPPRPPSSPPPPPPPPAAAPPPPRGSAF